MNRCGTTRRLQALVAIGWDTEHLASQLGWTPNCLTAVLNGSNPPNGTHHPVATLYDRLSMTPGPNPDARTHAQQHGWAPPLAWDDDDLDNPTGTPADGWQRHTPKQPFTARYAEWRQLGYTDLEITRRFNIRADTLATMLYRAGLPVTPQLAEASHQRKHRGRAYA
jgi:hypothetical protein